MEPAADSCRSPAGIQESTSYFPCCTERSVKMERCRVCSSWRTCRTSARACWLRRVSMDKEMMKRVAKERGLPVVEYRVVSGSGDAACGELGFPVFVKPANLGSSVGISKARNCEELKAALELARSYDRKVIIERGITGREFECAVLGNEDPVARVAVRDSALARVLRLRRQVSAGPGPDRDPGRSVAGADRRTAAAGSWNVIARWSAKAWRAWTS